MITIDNLYSLLVALESIGFCFLFSWSFKKRPRFFFRMALSVIFSLIVGFFSESIHIPYFPILSISLNYFLVFTTLPLSIFFCFEIPFSSSLFLSIISYSFRHLIYLAWQLFSYIGEDVWKINYDSFSYHWLILALISTLILSPFGYILKKRIKDNPHIALPSTNLILASFFFLVITIILNIFALSYRKNDSLPESLPYVLNLFAMISSGMIIMILIGSAKQIRLESEIVAVNQLRHQEEKQYEMTKESIDLINIKCHDLRHQIRALSQGKTAVSKEELESIEHAISIYDTKMKTGNPSLDIILQEKSLICKKNCITFDFIIDGKQLFFIKESDIYSLFGNIIDNAIESCMKIKNTDKRTITLKVKAVADGVFCYEENPIEEQVRFKNGLPISTKGDDRYHGFGMKSIANIVNSYHGTLKIKAEKDRYCLSIYFPETANPKNKSQTN